MKAQEEIRQLDAFKQDGTRLQALVESSSLDAYEGAYTTGNFR
jgi:hypothetical protein